MFIQLNLQPQKRSYSTYVLTILFLALFANLAYSEDSKWHTLKSLKDYPASSYNLKNGVEYLEIRLYNSTDNKKFSSSYKVPLHIGKRKLNTYSKRIIKKFKNSKPNLSRGSSIREDSMCIMSGCGYILGNGFMIDSKGIIWNMNESPDIVEMLGEIDTPAEIKLIIWLNNKFKKLDDEKHKDKYRKTSTGYEIISEYENHIDNLGECGIFRYKISIDKNGNILNKKLLSKLKSKGCLALD